MGVATRNSRPRHLPPQVGADTVALLAEINHLLEGIAKLARQSIFAFGSAKMAPHAAFGARSRK
jgi:hypothetical protein